MVYSTLPIFHSSIVELFLEKTKIQKTIEEQILVPPDMAQLGQPPHIYGFQAENRYNSPIHPPRSILNLPTCKRSNVGTFQRPSLHPPTLPTTTCHSQITNPLLCSSKNLIQITKRNKSSYPHLYPSHFNNRISAQNFTRKAVRYMIRMPAAKPATLTQVKRELPSRSA